METKQLQKEVVPLPVVPSPADETGAKKRLWTPVGLRFHLAVILTLGTLALLAYANSFNCGFALDNKFIILEDPRLREVNRENLARIFTQDYWWPKAVSGLYRPLTTVSYLLNYTALGSGTAAAGYHWINLLLHWANSILAYFVILVLMGNIWPAFFAAALFVVHPIATESVTNIIGRADLFAAACVLGGFLCYAKSEVTAGRPLINRTKGSVLTLLYLAALGYVVWKLPTWQLDFWTNVAIFVAIGLFAILVAGLQAGWAKIPWLAAVTVIAVVGVFSKESAAVLIGVAGLYDITYRIEKQRANGLLNLIENFWDFFRKGYLAMVPAYAALVYVRSQVFAKMRPPELPWVDNPLVMPGSDFWTQQFTAIKVIGKYIWLLIWPQKLSPDYSYNQIPLVDWGFTHWEDWKALFALIAIVVLILVAIRNYRRNPSLFFFVMFFFIALSPTSNLVRIIGSIMAERFMYLPLVAFAGCLVIAIYAICRRLVMKLDVSAWALPLWLQVGARTLLVLLIVGYGARTFARNFDWENDVTLWQSAVKVSPDSFKTHKSLAYAMYEADPENKEIDAIIIEGEKAKAITAKTQIVLLHLGAYYRIKGDQLAQRAPDGTLIPTPASREKYTQSVNVLMEAVPLDREFNEDNFQKELRRGRRTEEILDVGNHEIYWNLGLSLMRLARYDEALEAYKYMRHLAPTNPDAYLSIASVNLSRGKLEEAAIAFLQTLLLDNSRQETLRYLVELYRQIDREGCAVVFNAGQPKLNVDCKIVSQHMCTAYFELVQLFIQAKQYALAQQTRENALQNYKCDPQPFDQALAAPVTQPPASK